MSNLNSLELQNLPHLIGAHETIADKLNKIRVKQSIIIYLSKEEVFFTSL
ncbi:hypothetical protein VT91_30800 [Clostridium sporogenes]|nr:hypothetical protein [Clostridium botulinum]KRU24270.1 hypothetical protein WG71_35280 [Clostridium sporogenes]KRU26139.1 hypothetical protein VT91_30800 [Clostridium sporogenes]KRU27195.1 hypothetical protein VT28_27060 [Clostridium sporogenes]KRU49055.1 hypothetical protein VT95_04360 [Clostridium sporogenes]MBZ1328724.1 hypothetical protein [Clostridium botulinum]